MTIKPHIRAVIFDLGGVLLRTNSQQPRIELATRFGISPSELEEIIFYNPISQKAERGEASVDQVWVEIASLLNRPVEEMPEIQRKYFEADQVDFDLIKLIQQLRGQYKTALLSNTWFVDLPTWMRDTLQIPDTFDVIISSAYHRMAKPEPGIFQLALDMVGAQPEETVFVDDNEKNIAAANALGIHTIRFKNAEQARNELLNLLKSQGNPNDLA